MSFQGDVAGIGLGELLQGLARGGRDGVLTLHSEDLTATLGLHGGQLFILPPPDEDQDQWRRRAQDAWAQNPDAALEGHRRKVVAEAGRLEHVYHMLQAPNLHFRFDPGPLPAPAGATQSPPPAAVGMSLDIGATRTAPQSSPWGKGTTVEFFLLEHARIADERSQGPGAELSAYDLARALDPGSQPGEVRDLLTQCDGASTLEEIADRLGWPLSQLCTTLGDQVTAGRVRIALPREQLATAQRELELGRFGRAATRLTGWLRGSAAGPPAIDDSQLLLGEWKNGRLQHLLEVLPTRDARSLVRKLDVIHQDPRACYERWSVLREAHRGDELTAMREAALRLVSTEQPDARVFHDLLRIARGFHEHGHPQRTRTLLRLAASHLPSRPQVRVELGKRMMETGLVEEGTRWLLDTARTLNDAGRSDRALIPIRAVLRAIPDQPEANELLIETRELQVRRRRRRTSTIAGGSLVVVLGLTAVVKFHSSHKLRQHMTLIEEQLGDPGSALQLIRDLYGEHPPEEVAELRDKLDARKRDLDHEALALWTEEYDALVEECETGDPVAGLRGTLALAPRPTNDSRLPGNERQDLFGILSARMGKVSAELDLPITARSEELHREQRFMSLLRELLRQIDPEGARPDASSFHFRLAELLAEVETRREKRARERERHQAKERERNQNSLLGAARAHDAAGDLERAMEAYDRLVMMDSELAMLPELRKEIDKCRDHRDGVRRAEELCEEGEHEAAEAALDGVCQRPVEHLFPWRVESRPSGARVRFSNGEVRTTPFVARSGFGERVDLRFESADCEERAMTITRPADLVVHLHRYPERSWSSEHDIEAPPVAVGDDHIVTDRRGRIARLDRNSSTKWETELGTLGGIARTPVFLPERPGHLLVITEEGKAWLVDASNGKAKGPRDIGSPPREGPTLTRGGVTVSFADDRVAVWTDRLEPTFYASDPLVAMPGGPQGSEDHARNATLVVLRNDVARTPALTSPWTDWRAVVDSEAVRVIGPDGRGFTVARNGSWSFVAWESPKAMLSLGRLWISDEDGLRSYLPRDERLSLLDED